MGQGAHLVLAGVDLHRGDPVHIRGQVGHHALAVGDAAGDQDGVDLALEDGGHGADFLGDVVQIGVCNQLEVRIVHHLVLDFQEIVGAQVGHRTAAAVDHLLDFLRGIFAAEADVGQLLGRQAAGALGAEGAVAVEGIVGVDHAALAVGAYRGAAAQVDDDQVEVFVFDALLGRIHLGDGLLVEGVEHRDALEERMTRHAGQVAELIDHHRVGDEGAAADFLGDGVGQDAAQVAGVLTVLAAAQVFEHPLVDLIDARGDGAEQAAAAHDGCDLVQRDVVFLERLHDHLLAEFELGDDVGIFSDLLSAVAEGLGEGLLIVFEHRDLGRGGAGVDSQDLHVGCGAIWPSGRPGRWNSVWCRCCRRGSRGRTGPCRRP